jgi:hypothetical protein
MNQPPCRATLSQLALRTLLALTAFITPFGCGAQSPPGAVSSTIDKSEQTAITPDEALVRLTGQSHFHRPISLRGCAVVCGFPLLSGNRF